MLALLLSVSADGAAAQRLDLPGSPIQPLYLGHTDDWVDYSHGVRLVQREILVDGTPMDRLCFSGSARRSRRSLVRTDHERVRDPHHSHWS